MTAQRPCPAARERPCPGIRARPCPGTAVLHDVSRYERMPLGKTCLSSRSETTNVLRRASTFLLWLHALSATSAQAAPAANHRSDSTPRGLSSRLRRSDDAGLG